MTAEIIIASVLLAAALTAWRRYRRWQETERIRRRVERYIMQAQAVGWPI